jgi:actin-like ATPase involved in cell morphogenesis
VGYFLGIDIGTTYTAAAVWRDGRYDVAGLGNRAPTIPSVILLRDDETVLTGEAAARRAATEPSRVAREFKRRLGDPTPIIVSGTPYSADALMAKLLRWVVERVAEAEGGPADGVAVTHPANWGPFKIDLLRQAIRMADLGEVTTLSEPEAAAIHYASLSRVEPGSVIAVYDLGGGTFDAAVLRKTDGGWDVLGTPEGIERLGGIDFDEAVYQYVASAVGGAIDELDPNDPTAQAAVSRLRQECVEAKEALSSDTDVSIPVMLPNLQTEVRLTRAEYEQLVRPALTDTISATQRALRSADVNPGQVTAVLLVGGSSRTPLVAEMVSSALGRPVAVDAHPKHGVALGAAITAAEVGLSGPTTAAAPGPAAGAAAAGAATLAASAAMAGIPDPGPAPTVATAGTEAWPAPPPAPPGPPPAANTPVPPAPMPPPGLGGDEPPLPPPTGEGGDGKSRRGPLLVGAGLVVLALVGVAAALTLGGGDDDPPDNAASDTTTSVTQQTTTTTAPTTTTTEIPAGPFVNIRSVDLTPDDKYVISYSVTGYTPNVDDPEALHIHFFLNTTDPANAGINGDPPGEWELTDELNTYTTQYGPESKGAASQMCSAVAEHDHSVFDQGTLTGNCVDLPS